MRFEHGVRIGVPRGTVWELLMDVPRVARCVPGAESVTPLGDDRYLGALRVQVGPVRVRLEGQIAIVERDENAGSAAILLDATDAGSASGVAATVALSLADAPPPAGSQPQPASAVATDLRLETDARILGRLGELGQPIIKRKADQLIREFARNLERTALAGS